MSVKFLQNIDAERNKFEEAGFEVVNALPTTNLFAGRQVSYNGKAWYHNGTKWIDLTVTNLRTATSWADSNRRIPFTNSADNTVADMGKDDFYYNPNTGVLGAGSFVKKGGTADQFLMADGSVNSNTKIQFKRTIIDTTNLDQDTWYPVSMRAGRVRHSICYIDYYEDTLPISWSTHHAGKLVTGHVGFMLLGSAWGDNNSDYEISYANTPLVFAAEHSWSKVSGIRTLAAIVQLSAFVVYLRGGASYEFNYTCESPILHSGEDGYVNDYNTCPLLTTIPNKAIEVNLGLWAKQAYDFSINNIEPTQTGTNTKQTNWVLQYLIQGVNWLRDNKPGNDGTGATGNWDINAATASSVDWANVANKPTIPTVPEKLPNPELLQIVTAQDTLDYDGKYQKILQFKGGNYTTVTGTAITNGIEVTIDTDISELEQTVYDVNDVTNGLSNTVASHTNKLNDLKTVAFSGKYTDLIDTPAALRNPNALKVVADGQTVSYDGGAAKTITFEGGNQVEVTSTNSVIGVGLSSIATNTVLGNNSGTTQAPIAISSITKINGCNVSLGGTAVIPGCIQYNNGLFIPKITVQDGRNYLTLYSIDGDWVNSFAFSNCTTTTVTSNDLDNWWLEDNAQYEFDSDVSNNLLTDGDFFANKLAPAMGNYKGTALKFKLRPTTVKDYKSALDTLMSNFSAIFDIVGVDSIKRLYNGSLDSAGDYSFDIDISRYTENEKTVYGVIKVTIYKSYE